ncbi:MAG TPA: hypothetical protein VE863_11510 [Pyrinomonadaceae bacterium]|jgi:hypothetical protein|nr:hypothetical protein [Pyrinomonadaceae bacterium]
MFAKSVFRGSLLSHVKLIGAVFALTLMVGSFDMAQAQWTTPDSNNNINNTNSGNVGIGTTSPGGKLDVKIATNNHFALWDAAGGFGYTGPLIDAYDDSNGLVPLTFNASKHVFYNGNVGIGTLSPSFPLHVSRSASDQYLGWFENTQSSPGIGRLSVQNTAAQGRFEIDVLTDGSTYFQTGKTANSPNLSILSGNVGIGTTSPGYKLDVNGTINSNSTITGNNIVAKYQDVAEWVPSSEQLSPGTVVVLDSTKSNQVTSSSISYDTRVAGVVSEQPGIALGEKSDGKALVATTGRVRVKVDADKGSIHIGDLLVTSDVAGVAMKSEPVILGGVQIHRPGTLIGKALEPLEKGKGEILVLLSLQ